jgi:hypothetical protein
MAASSPFGIIYLHMITILNLGYRANYTADMPEYVTDTPRGYIRACLPSHELLMLWDESWDSILSTSFTRLKRCARL